jgi:hypothetical protein
MQNILQGLSLEQSAMKKDINEGISIPRQHYKSVLFDEDTDKSSDTSSIYSNNVVFDPDKSSVTAAASQFFLMQQFQCLIVALVVM